MFNRYDICEAYYLFASLYHSGQDSKEYGYLSRLSKIDFNPSINLTEDKLTEYGKMVFDGLIARNGF